MIKTHIRGFGTGPTIYHSRRNVERVPQLSRFMWMMVPLLKRITMWMQYSASQWPVAENLNLAVERMSCELNALSFEYHHETVYGNSAFDEESVMYYMKESEKYDLGAKLCQKYIYNVLDLDEFCTLMVLANLKCFLANISHFLPEDVVNKFQLNDPPSYEDAGDAGEESEVANTENS
ncbi:hypothetical protein NQ318_007508 [Aromia moschata]|uniref:Uncharacterized protein n=1 Tax=Aromia moschata TaxID=1265417 RepID=A0AAV8YCN5_9CUCU|nr:hypothetical protein NQ318_007508 [Aromia moschata]